MKLKHKIKRHICVTLTLVAANSFAAQNIILADDGKAGDSFGYGVAIDGNTVLVGAFKADIDGVIDAGAAYVFVLGDNGWQKQAKLVADPGFAEGHCEIFQIRYVERAAIEDFVFQEDNRVVVTDCRFHQTFGVRC